jgi:dTDP-4-dehydrorhamnose reductase
MTFQSVTILGGRGMLGTDLAEVAAKRGFGVQVYDLPEFDIANEKQLQEVISQSEVIVNWAAYTNVEKAESDCALANEINGHAVGRLGRLAKEAHCPVLHISTDFVFDGEKDSPYEETDAPNPVSAYGRSKRLGETLLIESGCQACIVRVEWTYGAGGVNFITKMLEAAKTRDMVKVVDDQIGSPTHTAGVAKALCEILGADTFPAGLYHCASQGYTSRYEMTRFLFEARGIGTKIEPCKTSDFKSAAKRPLNSRFNCEKLQTLLGRSMPTWQEMLKNYLATN